MVSRMAGGEREEVELKLGAADAGPLDVLARLDRLGPASLGPPGTASETDVYLDTRDGRLATARWACRLRSRGGRTIVSLKGPATATGGGPGQILHRRPEVEGPATAEPRPSDWPPSEARDRLAALTGGAQLVERFSLRQERTERSVHRAGAPVGILSLDRVEILHDGRSAGRLFAVELELAPGEADDASLVGDLATALTAISGLHPDPRTKLEHALAIIAPPATPGRTPPSGR